MQGLKGESRCHLATPVKSGTVPQLYGQPTADVCLLAESGNPPGVLPHHSLRGKGGRALWRMHPSSPCRYGKGFFVRHIKTKEKRRMKRLIWLFCLLTLIVWNVALASAGAPEALTWLRARQNADGGFSGDCTQYCPTSGDCHGWRHHRRAIGCHER